GDLLDVELRARPLLRQAHRGHDLAGLENRHVADVDRGPDEEFLGRYHAFALFAVDHDRPFQRDHRRRAVRRRHRDAARRAEQAMLAVLSLRRVGIAGIAAGAITVDARAVVPATRVLAQIPAQGAGVADLRARDARGGARQHGVLRLHDFAL